MSETKTPRQRALIALLLIAPVPSIGVIVAMVAAPGPVGHAFFLAAKVWLVVFPAAWYLLVEKGQASWSPPRRGGLGVGLISGIGIAAAIVLGSWLFGVQNMDLSFLQAEVRQMGLDDRLSYLVGASAWTFANSLVEEYLYRWFIFRQCEELLKGPAAIIASALIFTVHHVIAVSQYLDPVYAVLASVGVFIGGALWSWLYMRYRSIWPGWLSHVFADLAVFGVGYWLLF